MTTVLERVREALAPEYRVEREIARGGMGIVFLARETLLDRPVAIKVVRPELATAHAVDKFLREARILANLRHGNVIPVHRADEADGFFYYAMDYVDGETLADRLIDGPLRPNEVLKLGRDLLDALDAVHAVGVVHRDIKPSNILLVDGRAILTDFGIARPSVDPAHLTASQPGVVGTIGYMPPEQAYGWEVTARTDLFAVAAVLYEAYTGRRWGDQRPDQKPDWSGVPRQIVSILRQALTWEPSERWPDATTFRHKLWKTRTTRYRRRTLALTVGGVVAGLTIARLAFPPRPVQEYDVAVLPFEAGPGVSLESAQGLTDFTRQNLDVFKSVANRYWAERMWNQAGQTPESIGPVILDEFGINNAVHGLVRLDDVDTTVRLTVIDNDGIPRDAGTIRLGGGRSYQEIGHAIGLGVVAIIDPNGQDEYEGPPLSDVDEAVLAYLDGLREFKRNAFETAHGYFATALDLDSTFGRAQWWYHNSWRWRLTGEPPPRVDLQRLLDTQGEYLPEPERMLIHAQLAPTETERLALYREVIEGYPRDGYAAFLYADEMQTRGPYIGISLEESTRELVRAVAKDTSFGPAHLDLLWAYLRLGPRDSAESNLGRYQKVYAKEEGVSTPSPDWPRLLIPERFEPGSGLEELLAVLQHPVMGDTLRAGIRLLGIWDMAPLQDTLSEMALASAPASETDTRAHLHEGRGLALIGLGQVSEGLKQIDSAAALFGTDSAHLEAAEWRVVAPALRLPGVATGEIERGRTALHQLLNEPASRARAAWALGVDAAHRSSADEIQVWLDTLHAMSSDTVAQRLATLLNAIDRGARGEWRVALAVSDSALQYDSAGYGGDPFARAALHLMRAEWYDSLGQPDEADRSRLWYEHFEFLGFPEGSAQASEIDWALSPLARMQRGRAAAIRGEESLWSWLVGLLPWVEGKAQYKLRACTYFNRLGELWSNADVTYDSLKTELETYSEQRCR